MAKTTAKTIAAADVPYKWARDEVRFDRDCKKGDKGRRVKTVQEWLCLWGHGLKADGEFGPATELAVRRFQGAAKLPQTGTVDAATHGALTAPMLRALTLLPAQGKSYGDLVVAYAKQHLAEHPVEVGGQNCGPWVRLYMLGNEGSQWAWCAGFSCFVHRQAADTLGVKPKVGHTFSCDTLAADAKQRGLLVSEKDLAAGRVSKADMPPGSFFLNRRTPTDWVHTGLVLSFQDEVFETIEGNTNDDGDREGYEVCRRLRGYAQKDFIRAG